MEGPQNGVNGNIPPQQLGYACINTQMPRGGHQPIMNFDHMQQVMPNQSVSPAYNVPHFAAMRSMSPTIQQGPYQYPYPQYVSMAPAPYPPAIYAPQQYQQQYNNYQPELPPPSTKPKPNPQVRKLNPLTVVDPVSKTDVDLSKYQATSDKNPNANVLSISEPTSGKNSITESNGSEKDQSKHINTDSIKQDIIPIEKTESTNEDILHPLHTNKDDHCLIKKDDDNNIEIINENIVKVNLKELLVDIDQINAIETEKENSDTLQDSLEYVKHEESSIDLKLDEVTNHLKYENEEENIAASSEEDTIVVDCADKFIAYHLPVDTKDSDETTMKKKQTYDREYLIRLKDCRRSRQRPENMPQEFNEYLLLTPRHVPCHIPDSPPSQLNLDKSNNKKQAPNRQYSGGNKKYPRPPKHINLDIPDNQTFIRSKSGYLPPQLRDKQSAIDHFEELKRNIKTNLNKITPQNFQECLAEIEKLNIAESEEMLCLINEIFIKAVKEEAYSVTYAQFCNKLAGMYSVNNSFKSQLLKRCQDMFETPLKEQLYTVKKDWELKISNEMDSKMKALYESDLEEQVKKAKDKYFGNIRFIGELFLHNLLAAKVILNCINELLKGFDESDAMLALCKLLETCGKQIDIKHKEQMNQFIGQILDLSQCEKMEKRIRFKLRDIIDMRERDWTSRHIQREKKINPKTFQELKDEAAAEASASMIKLAAMNKKRNNNNITNPGARRNISTPAHKVTIKKLTCNSHAVDEKTVLGPSGGSWVGGSGSKCKSNEFDGWTSVGSQRQKNPGVKYTSNSRSREQSPQVPYQHKTRNLESSAEASGADSRSSTPPIGHPLNKSAKIIRPIIREVRMSDEDRAKKIFSDLLSTGHLDVDSWMLLDSVNPVIEQWIDDMMEKDAQCRRHVGDSFTKLLKEKKLTTTQIIQGTQTFVQSIDDLICDIPKLWEFFAQFLERFIETKNSDIRFFEKIFMTILPNKEVAQCLANVFHDASNRLGHDIVGQVFHQFINWNNIVIGDMSKFIESNRLEVTVKGRSPPNQIGGEPIDWVVDQLNEMLSKDSPNESIYEFLEKHIDKPTWKKTEFIRALTTSILRAIPNKSEFYIRDYLKNRKEILKRVSNHKVEHEKEILISILQITHDLKSGVLPIIYDILITEHIVSDSVIDWYLADSSLQSESNYKTTSNTINQIVVKKDKHR